MILYDYKVFGSGEMVRVEAYDYNRSSTLPAFELEVAEGGPINEYYLGPDNRTTDLAEGCIPVAIKVNMIAEIQESVLKLQRAERRLRDL